VLVIDLCPPARHEPNGINELIWEYLNAEMWQAPRGCPLSFASYCAKSPIAAYVEPIAVGMRLTDMPLFLTTQHYVNVPLEATYMAAWRGVPERWRQVIEA
jgi:hypothetical protein